MKIVSFDHGQGGEDWLNWRKNGIGASDISGIMRTNPYSTPFKIWNIKCGYQAEASLNPYMEHGIKTEDIARQWMNENYQLYLKPVCIEEEDKSFFRASLDGFDFDQKVLVEIKCPSSEKVLDQARISSSIPSYWYDQVQWQIMLSQPTKAMIALWDFRYNSCITVEICGSSRRIDEMRKEGEEFWKLVKMGKSPPLDNSDYLEISDDKLHELLLEYQDLCSKGKAYSDRKKELKKSIEAFGNGNNFIAHGFKVCRVDPRRSYDMDQMRMDGIDIDHYLKKSESLGSYRIICSK